MVPLAECASTMLPLLLLLACWCSTGAAFGWFGPYAVGRGRLPVEPITHQRDTTPRILAYSPSGGRQQDNTNRTSRGSGFSLAIQSPTSRGLCAGPSARPGRTKSTAGRLRHRVNMLNNGGGGMELFCDQCGDLFYGCAFSSYPSPAFSSSLDPPLAVCRAPGCGVSFSQCARCKEEYAGCCSSACQALAAEREPAPVAAAAEPSREMGMRVEQRLNGQGGEEPAGLGAAGSAVFRQAGVFQRGGGAAAVPARASSSEQEGGGNREGETPSRLPATPGSGSNAKSMEGGGEGWLESYASRHSEPESSCLAAVREATTRSQPGGAHMVSGHLQGELLKLLVKLSGAKRVLDIGTFTGYSALAFAEALPEDGVVVTLESDARAADTARGHFASSEHGGKIRLLLGKAMDGIDQMISKEAPQFDIIFIDADKKRYWDYYDKLLSGPRPLLAPEGVLLADNVLFHELVPLAEAMQAAAAAPAAARGAVGTAKDSEEIAGVNVNEEALRAREGVNEAGVPGREEEKRPGGVVGGGVLPATPRRLKIAESLDGFNKRVREDVRVEVMMLPLRDGLSVVTWRRGGYPTDNEC